MSDTSNRYDINTPFPISLQEREAFWRDGFIKLKHVLSAEAIRYYGPEISRKVLELNTMHLPMSERTIYQKAFLKIMNLWQQGGIIREFVFSQRLASIAAQLLGVSSVRLFHDQAFYKEPGGGYTPWRADGYDWPLASDKVCTAWIPLQQTSLEMGPLAFAAGSHRFVYTRDQGWDEETQARIEATMRENGFRLVETPYDIGEVSFHLGGTFHYARGNETDQIRAAVSIIYMDAQMRLKAPENAYQQLNWYTWFPGAKIGEVIATPLNPILYPRED
ncbi:MAG: phytanoyl-CoA dioxygenase family protein [Anaerolineae bacterium]|nr:phytanoyl-CoA dioxygenase family protein [Thermoflexales bacterium]MDW8408571.1 phytanoyl-CoA dioxygenase family protein [Anaerolineae bacterium]